MDARLACDLGQVVLTEQEAPRYRPPTKSSLFTDRGQAWYAEPALTTIVTNLFAW